MELSVGIPGENFFGYISENKKKHLRQTVRKPQVFYSSLAGALILWRERLF